MKQQEVFKKIGVIIQEINEQYEYLQGTMDSLNDLELELFVANTHFLKDHAEILRKLNAIKSEPVKTPSIKDEPKWFEPVVQPAKPAPVPFKAEPARHIDNESVKFDILPPTEAGTQDDAPAGINLSSNTPADTYSFEREEPETIRHELELNEADTSKDETENLSQDEELLTPVAEIEPEEVNAEEDVTEPEVQDQSKQSKMPEPALEAEKVEIETPVVTAPVPPAPKTDKPVAESMEDIQVDNLKAVEKDKKVAVTGIDEDEPVLTLNQRLSAQRKEQPAKPAEVIEPLADMKSAITLNDKLLFVKDLFKGYNLAYTEAIEIVNRFTSFEEADRFLKNNYVTKNNWEGKKETSDKFYALLRRRYA